ncbi:MAG: hypothetical protein AMK73_06525 [Planctomycetes bacterium SM23_32]|nr:MAG: hypothetical protein AMK73_06525 [Planctomycetes bacterium SM23_32]
MDKKTFAQFLIASTLILLVWWAASYVLYGPHARGRQAPPAAPPAAGQEGRAPALAPAPGAPPESLDETAPTALPPAPTPEPEPEPVEAVLDNGVLSTTWTNRGAALRRLQLLDERYRAPYKEAGKRPVLTLLRDFQEGLLGDTIEAVTFFDQEPDGTVRELGVAAADAVYRLEEREPDRLVFRRTLADRHGHALEVGKTVRLEANSHHCDVTLEFRNASEEPFEFSCALRGPAGIERESLQSTYLGVRVAKFEGDDDYDIDKIHPRNLAKKGPQTDSSTNIAWAALVNHYFAAVMLPEDRSWVDTVVARVVTDTDVLNARGRWRPGTVRRESDRQTLARQNAAVVINTERRRLEAGESVTWRYRLAAVPKEDEVLASYGAGLEGLVEYGMWPALSRLTVAVLNGVYAVIPNYGIAILLVTAIVRVILHPLTLKGQLGMIKMQKLQPQLAELQRKHADDKQRLSQEQWKLWQRYGVSPLSGCWPMLLQMPILIALFGALRAAIELRHAGFLWIGDLSRPDTIFRLPIYLPFLGNEVNPLPILMSVVMFVNQRFMSQTPATAQARQQQAMMKFFPIFLAALFYHMPSGLCLYFTASTAIGALERWIIEKRTAGIELKPVGEGDRKRRAKRRPSPGEPGKKGWLDKLQKLQDRFQQDRRTARRRGKKDGGKK